MNWKRTARWSWFALPFLLLALWPGLAAAADATLYELTENMKLKGLQDGSPDRRLATSALMGTANPGTPLCPLAVSCTVNATGSDNIDIATGLGTFNGQFTVVVQGDNPVDGPEFVVMRGNFSGKMDFSPALLADVPYGTVTGHLTVEKGRGKFPFTGTFYLPFVIPGDPTTTPYYLDFASPYGVVPVADNQRALGYPTVKFEIDFGG